MIGHTPKANGPIDELPEITALLKELPRVSAPTDFNASLQARLAAAKTAAQVEADEFAGVTALLKELPRVAAPSDFDFKLRARLAQAKAEQQEASAGWLALWFRRSFSWVQVSAAMAAVAIAVSVITFGVLRSDESATPSDNPTTIAKTVDPAPTLAPTPDNSMSEEPKEAPLSVTNVALPNTGIKPKTMNRGARSGAAAVVHAVQPSSPFVPVEITRMAAAKVMIKSRSGEARMVNLSEYNLGLQTAHLRATPKAATNSGEAMTNIY